MIHPSRTLTEKEQTCYDQFDEDVPAGRVRTMARGQARDGSCMRGDELDTILDVLLSHALVRSSDCPCRQLRRSRFG